MVWVQPLLVALVLSRLTETLVQHKSNAAGGLVGIEEPQVMTRLLHWSTDADGRTVMVRTQVLLVPQHWS